MSVDSPTVKNFRDNVLHLIGEMGISQVELAERCGMSRPNMNRVFHGKQVPSMDWVDIVAEALGVDASRLLREPNSDRRAKSLKAS